MTVNILNNRHRLASHSHRLSDDVDDNDDDDDDGGGGDGDAWQLFIDKISEALANKHFRRHITQ